MRLLYIVHRIPYPPNKGDKIRSYNEMLFLSRHFEVDLVCFMGSHSDQKHIRKLQGFCRSVSGFTRGMGMQALRLLGGFLTGRPLSVALYDHPGMHRKVKRLIQEHDYERIVIFSGQMAQYVPAALLPRTIIDFCDVDSHKWDNYADRLPFYLGWFYRLEARRLLAFEAEASKTALTSIFITPSELKLFRDLGGGGRLICMGNGVDTEFFSPGSETPEPGRILFTGAMDYFPNEEGVTWFAREVFPSVRGMFPHSRFVIAGSNPTYKVRALARMDGVEVTGFVEDMRKEQAKAHIVVVPLRIARGMQNKVLEAMACGKAVVVGRKAMGGILAVHGRDLMVAETPEEFGECIRNLLADPSLVEAMGAAARKYILDNLSWETHLAHGMLPLLTFPGYEPQGR
ncbi:MAG: TIGR03087 family PEP-CTERM/XrtA system glycosyltransferase [Fibrobacterota bacterium]|nr:TIGR03087 family PEP-CTERM/XrtA system glycosyltransferase [Fibrobacterota bacterium]